MSESITKGGYTCPKCHLVFPEMTELQKHLMAAPECHEVATQMLSSDLASMRAFLAPSRTAPKAN